MKFKKAALVVLVAIVIGILTSPANAQCDCAIGYTCFNGQCTETPNSCEEGGEECKDLDGSSCQKDGQGWSCQPKSCEVDLDCGDFSCDADTGKCVKIDACGNRCDATTGETCDAADGKCKPKSCDPTASPSTCPNGSECVAKASGSTTDGECKVQATDLCENVTCANPGESCDSADGECKPKSCDPTASPSTCLNGLECTDSIPPGNFTCQRSCAKVICGEFEKCFHGNCEEKCFRAEECEIAGEACDRLTGLCANLCEEVVCFGKDKCNPKTGLCQRSSSPQNPIYLGLFLALSLLIIF